MADMGTTKGGYRRSRRGPITDNALLEAYRQVLMCVFIATIFLILTLGLTLGIFAKQPKILIFVTMSGALGAFFSALMRLYNFQDLPRALIGPGLGLRNIYLVIYSLVPPVVGAIAATALYVAFASGLVQGGLFPEFDCQKPSGTCDGFSDFLEFFGPMGPENYGKILVWGFIAGFSERLVPDLLQRIAASGKADVGKKKSDE